MTKTVEASRSDWEHKLYAALWAFRTAYKNSTNQTPFQLVYGQEAVMPIEFLIPSLRIAATERLNDDKSLQLRHEALHKLCETRLMAVHALAAEKARRKAWHDRRLHKKDLKTGDLALMYKTKLIKGKLKFTGEGPYKVKEILNYGAIILEHLDGKRFDTPVNGS
ncbi:hypothetical protein O6H91_07G077200 [Diphasiastrum complanatum]|uniref:Uncharacterized protein n=1 Tax=Diphasiastrum complanatum TaxID=34168 RepID=A0ACC2D6W9_DIPCM|nr:hypothetical protein O6H91_07G077200 [Diphasiastrum complanatum]